MITLKRHEKNNFKQFTIIELLVVIAILILLTGILLPAINRAKKSSKKIKCLSNLRQIGTAINFYGNDNKGFFPFNCTSQKEANPTRTHLKVVLNLTQSPKIFECPDDSENLFLTEESSYIWNWTQVELPGNEKMGIPKYNTIPYGGFVPASNFAVMSDAGPYHGLLGNYKSFNALYADGSVDDATRINF